jgi:hypothetical protein
MEPKAYDKESFENKFIEDLNEYLRKLARNEKYNSRVEEESINSLSDELLKRGLNFKEIKRNVNSD